MCSCWWKHFLFCASLVFTETILIYFVALTIPACSWMPLSQRHQRLHRPLPSSCWRWVHKWLYKPVLQKVQWVPPLQVGSYDTMISSFHAFLTATIFALSFWVIFHFKLMILPRHANLLQRWLLHGGTQCSQLPGQWRVVSATNL